jgi:pimeloyl-ACP methyl ester carboxylesterase
MKGLFLYGAKCNVDIWDKVKPGFSDIDIEYVDYPRDLTRTARTVSVLARWMYDLYGNDKFDFILGHSMGGFVALHLVLELPMNIPKLIMVESNPRPAEVFYRNLMTPKNLAIHGDYIKSMFDSEACNYNDALLMSVRDGFDDSDLIRNYQGEIHAIFGDRGIADYPNRISDLNLDQDVREKMRFHFVQDACHLPMIENPQQFSAIVRKILIKEKIT